MAKENIGVVIVVPVDASMEKTNITVVNAERDIVSMVIRRAAVAIAVLGIVNTVGDLLHVRIVVPVDASMEKTNITVVNAERDIVSMENVKKHVASVESNVHYSYRPDRRYHYTSPITNIIRQL